MADPDPSQHESEPSDAQPVRLEHDADTQRQPELLRGIWHAPRGPFTKAVAWVLLLAIALALLAMLAIIVLGPGV
jgi:hypothetical protein